MICYPNAKINLGLNVVSRRSDGYHNIESVFYPVNWVDILEVIEDNNTSKGIELFTSGIEIPGNPKDNLLTIAYDIIAKEYNIGAIKAHLHKQIPIGAGLGGGSADCAFFVNALNKLFSLNISIEKRKKIVAQLGADCPFFIDNKPAYVTGIGDEMVNINFSLKGKYIYLVNPGIHVSTKDAYAGLFPEKSNQDLRKLIQTDIYVWNGIIKNDFEKSIFKLYPEIKKLKQEMYDVGAIYASMSGSGSTVFGIFESDPELEFAQKDFFKCYI